MPGPAGSWRDRDGSGPESPQGINALVAGTLVEHKSGCADPAAQGLTGPGCWRRRSAGAPFRAGAARPPGRGVGSAGSAAALAGRGDAGEGGDPGPGGGGPDRSAPGRSAPGRSAPGHSAPGHSAPGHSAPGAQPLVAQPLVAGPDRGEPARLSRRPPQPRKRPGPIQRSRRSRRPSVTSPGPETRRWASSTASCSCASRSCASCSRPPWTSSGTGCSGRWGGSWRACPRRMRWRPTCPSWAGTIASTGSSRRCTRRWARRCWLPCGPSPGAPSPARQNRPGPLSTRPARR